AVKHVEKELDVSQRRACRVVEQPRSTQRYVEHGCRGDCEIVKRLQELSRQHPRYGYRFMTALLRREGLKINRKRVQRLWREAGLKVPARTVKKRRLGGSENACFRRRAERPNHVWSHDFVMDQTSDGRRLKILTVVDEYTRECLALEAERCIEARGCSGSAAKNHHRARSAGKHPVRQRRIIHRTGREKVFAEQRSADAVHRAGRTVGERIQRNLQQSLWR